MPKDPAAVVRALRACREAMIEVHRSVRPMGPCYHAASMVLSAIDGFAAFLTGERHYFSEVGSGATSGQMLDEQQKLAQERGETRWEP